MPSEASKASARTGRFFAKVVDDPAGRHLESRLESGGFTDTFQTVVRGARPAARVDNRGLLRVHAVRGGTMYSARVRVLYMVVTALRHVPDDIL